MGGKFRDQTDFHFCRCEYQEYAEQIVQRADCISRRRTQAANVIYKEVVRVYNCRLSEDGCEIAVKVKWSGIIDNYRYSPPQIPACVRLFANRRFYDVAEAENCGLALDAFKRRLEAWRDDEVRGLGSDAAWKADQAIERFNCYARGGRICL